MATSLAARFLPPSDIIQVWHSCLLNAALPESQFLLLTESQSSKTAFRKINHAGACFVLFGFFFIILRAKLLMGKERTRSHKGKLPPPSTVHISEQNLLTTFPRGYLPHPLEPYCPRARNCPLVCDCVIFIAQQHQDLTPSRSKLIPDYAMTMKRLS